MWELEFSATSADGKRVEYQTLKQAGHSQAERRDRVTVSGRTVRTGWVSDHQGYEVYRRIVREGWTGSNESKEV